MRILDMSAGYRAIWFNRLHPDTVFVDIRPQVSPTVIANTEILPFPNNVFDLVVFDPPHVVNGRGSKMGETYGSFLADEIKQTIQKSSAEAYRCSTGNALMAFKWNDHDVRLGRLIDLMEGWEPLFGHQVATRHKHRSSTYWVLLHKRLPGYQVESSAQKVLSFPEDPHWKS
jgi:hypothetical protein